jgi:poly(3-hydroxybutyrate) depolymerase
VNKIIVLGAALLLCTAAWAQTENSGPVSEVVKIPAGPLMGPYPVAAQSKLIEKKAVFNGVERSWLEYVPASYKGDKNVPLVVAVHGGGGNADFMFRGEAAWAQVADQAGFIVIYPNGSIPYAKGFRWNGYPEFNEDPRMAISTDNHVDEALFLKQLIEKAEKDYKIDTSRVYMHGQSNGGMMVSYFILRYADMLAAAAPSSAPPSTNIMATFKPTTKVPVYFWGGEQDTLTGQYNPTNKVRTVLCKEFGEFWAGIDKTEAEPKLHLDGPYNTKVYAGEYEVRVTEFRNGIHHLPISTAYVIWNDFFSRFARGKNGEIVRLVPDAAQNASADKGAVAIKLGAAFALVDGKVVRIGSSPEDAPALLPGAPYYGPAVPASFVATAFGAKVEYKGDSEVQITTEKGTYVFTDGKTEVSLNGKPVRGGTTPTTKVKDDLLISLRVVGDIFGKKISARDDYYKNDIYYLSDRSVDLSAQTISFIEEKLLSKAQ